MKKDNTVYLKQIRDFISDIQIYIRGKEFTDLESDQMFQDAVIRKLELIGEAANRITEDFRLQHSNLPISSAVAIRNKLIHDYDEIELNIVWDTITNDLPKLQKAILVILGDQL